MGSLEMNGSYPLDDEMIDAMVSRTSPGNYALGYMDGTTFMLDPSSGTLQAGAVTR
jgi:hypothetical protein